MKQLFKEQLTSNPREHIEIEISLELRQYLEDGCCCIKEHLDLKSKDTVTNSTSYDIAKLIDNGVWLITSLGEIKIGELVKFDDLWMYIPDIAFLKKMRSASKKVVEKISGLTLHTSVLSQVFPNHAEIEERFMIFYMLFRMTWRAYLNQQLFIAANEALTNSSGE